MTEDWKVLLIGGSSCAGKTTLAESLARHFQARYIDLDLFWIVLERSVPPVVAPELHLLESDDVYQRFTPDELVRRHFQVAKYVCKAIEPLIAHHDIIGRRTVIEGCWLLPDLVQQSTFAGHQLASPLRSMFLIESSGRQIEARKMSRSPDWMQRLSSAARANHVEMERRFGSEVERQAKAQGLPVLSSRPFETLEARALEAIESSSAT